MGILCPSWTAAWLLSLWRGDAYETNSITNYNTDHQNKSIAKAQWACFAWNLHKVLRPRHSGAWMSKGKKLEWWSDFQGMDQGGVNDRLTIPNHMRLSMHYICMHIAIEVHWINLTMGPGVNDDLSISISKMYTNLTSSSADSFDKK